MKTTLFAPLLALGALAGTAVAQEADTMQAKYEKKLQKDFVSYGGWITDYDVARETAKKEGKVIFAYFSRSYSP